MKNKIGNLAITVATSVLFLSSCRSTDDYKRLAEAGTNYANALDTLLVTAGDIRLDATSEQLLKDDRSQSAGISAEDYIRLSEQDVKRLEILRDLRTHNYLLKRYFQRLQELATSNAPQQAQEEIGGIVNNLNDIGAKLRLTGGIGNADVFKGVTGFIISSQIRGALKDELEKRGKTIDLELVTQQEILNFLSKSIEQDVTLIQLAQEQRLVITPLIRPEPVNSVEGWIETRRKILTMKRNVEQLSNASTAISHFREIFKSFVEGEPESDRLNTLLSDIESFVEIVETLK
jgi:hypothetical protein